MYWEVRLGKHNIRQKEPTERTHQVAKLFHIKNYRAYDNDLAILKLEEKIEPNEYIRPICLPSKLTTRRLRIVVGGEYNPAILNRQISQAPMKILHKMADSSSIRRL